MSNPAAIRLQLEGANPRMNGVDLAVVLYNDSDIGFNVAQKMKAIIKYPNRKDAEVKVTFADEVVPAHGKIHGTIKVPFDKVDPTADLIIPNMLPPGYGPRDIHLTTSISLR